MKLEVLVSPLGRLALVYQQDGCVWLLKPGQQPKREFAPQMHNFHLDPWFVTFEVEDEFPFEVVLERVIRIIHAPSAQFVQTKGWLVTISDVLGLSRERVLEIHRACFEGSNPVGGESHAGCYCVDLGFYRSESEVLDFLNALAKASEEQ